MPMDIFSASLTQALILDIVNMQGIYLTHQSTVDHIILCSIGILLDQ